MADEPSASIVIATDGRARSLAETLESVRQLDYERFEVVAVHGPTDDGTAELLKSWARVKVAANPHRNLTVSRNIGIALAAGDIVAFIDDDAAPEPEWLSDLAAEYADPGVGGVGGFVVDHTGRGYQTRYMTLDRLGRPREWDRATPELNFPLSAEFPHLLGTNASFRRSALIDIGGFDEQIGRFLDESDVCCRMVDAGWILRQTACAYVHHRMLADPMRTETRVIRQWSPLVRNKLYFPLRHGRRHHTPDEIFEEVRGFTRTYRAHVLSAIRKGLLPREDRRRFRQETQSGWLTGLRAGLAEAPGFISDETLRRYSQPFRAFPSQSRLARKTYCLLSQDYPPGRIGGVARATRALAEGLAKLGHRVHVITRADGEERVDFEGSVWVRRIAVDGKSAPPPPPPGCSPPAHIWAYAVRALQEVEAVAARRPVDAVYAPLWDGEGLAVLADGRFPLVTALQTPLKVFLDCNPKLAASPSFMSAFAEPMLEVERRLLQGSAGVHAISGAAAADISAAYHVDLEAPHVTTAPLGLPDWLETPYSPAAATPEGMVRVLFAGRLERRKGIDVLMQAIAALAPARPHVVFDIVGRDEGGWRVAFEADPLNASCRGRVRFHGEANDEALRGLYRACDVFVAPSRYESLGLVLIEAMMFAKPVVACWAGGMAEVVQAGETGLLAEPGDAQSLGACLEALIDDAELRSRMGAAGRRRYEACFRPDTMAEAVAELLSRAAARAPLAPAVRPASADPPRAMWPPTPKARPAVAVVSSLIVRADAISGAARHSLETLEGEFAVTAFANRSDVRDPRVEVVGGLGPLLAHPAFLAADLVLYHFGVWHPFFDALAALEGRARQIVWFHDITPAALVPAAQQPLIEASARQLHGLRWADAVWATSEVSAMELAARGFDRRRVQVRPLAVTRPARMALATKRAWRVEILFVGRIVPAKGVLDLVEAAGLARRLARAPLRLTIVGNLVFSDRGYVARVREAAARLGGRFLGCVDDRTLERLYHRSHVVALPSRHEGFGVPVIEGLRAGCIPVGYDAYNTPNLAQGLGRMTPLGDLGALARTLAELADALASSDGRPDAPVLPLDGGRFSRHAFDAAAEAHIAGFSDLAVGETLLSDVREVLAKAPARAGVAR